MRGSLLSVIVLVFTSLPVVFGIPQLQAATSSSSEGCAAPENTLTSSCDDVCISNQTCLAYADSSSCTNSDCKPDPTKTCEYQCFDSNYILKDYGDAFVFLVTFGLYVSVGEETMRRVNPDFDDQVDALQDDTKWYAHASNKEVMSIEELSIPQSTNTVYEQLAVSTHGKYATNYVELLLCVVQVFMRRTDVLSDREGKSGGA